MGETLDHLEKVIRDIPEGSFTVDPTNHIEKVIQEVGQEVIGMIPSPSGSGELYLHNISITHSNFTIFLKIFNSSNSPITDNVLNQYFKNCGLTSFNNVYSCSGYSYIKTKNIDGLYYINDNYMGYVYGMSGDHDSIGVPFGSSFTFIDTVIQILGGE